MSRSPLFDSLRVAFRVAAIAARERPDLPPLGRAHRILQVLHAPPVSPRLGRRNRGRAGRRLRRNSRRHHRPSARHTVRTRRIPGPRIAIVGGGMAGLNAAYKLKQAGLTATIFEGASRTGGRMFTARDLLGDGLTTELGGEFIDSNHVEMLNLMTEFGLERLDTRAPAAASLKPETYFINGRHYTHAQATRAFVPIAKNIFADYDELGEVVNYQTEGGASALDQQSITQYLDGIGVTGWMRELIDVAYLTEYGLENSEQSALNFLFLIGTGDLEDPETLRPARRERRAIQGSRRQPADRRRAGEPRGAADSPAPSAGSDPEQGTGFHADVPGRREGRRPRRRHRRVDSPLLDPSRTEDAGRSAAAQDEGDSRARVRRQRESAGGLRQPAVGETRLFRSHLQRRDVSARVGQQPPAAGRSPAA